jgi:endonuclease YncB( thermonuclease family)
MASSGSISRCRDFDMSCVRSLLTALCACAWISGAAGQSVNSRWFAVPANAQFETGDSWVADGITYRLYGVQACLRGTAFTNDHGLRRDCGEASLAMLVALIRDLKPQCYDAAQSVQTRTAFVFCVATRQSDARADARIDLGTALIVTGFAFAAVKPDGQPVYSPYWVAEQVAAQSRAGLRAFADVPNPNAIILQELGHMPSPAATPTSSASSEKHKPQE